MSLICVKFIILDDRPDLILKQFPAQDLFNIKKTGSERTGSVRVTSYQPKSSIYGDITNGKL